MKCPHCKGGGLIYAMGSGAEGRVEYEYAFRCHACPVARFAGFSQLIPLWDDHKHRHLRNVFTTPKAEDPDTETLGNPAPPHDSHDSQ